MPSIKGLEWTFDAVEYMEEKAKKRAKIADKYGFEDIQYALYYRAGNQQARREIYRL